MDAYIWNKFYKIWFQFILKWNFLFKILVKIYEIYLKLIYLFYYPDLINLKESISTLRNTSIFLINSCSTFGFLLLLIAMDPCPFVRLTIGNPALKILVASKLACFVVHLSSSMCFYKIKLKNFLFNLWSFCLFH